MKTSFRAALLAIGVSLLGITANATSSLTVAVAIAQIICGGASTGNINITPGGGTGPYTYHWSNDSTTQNLNNLSAGNYSVTVTDANGNTGAASITVTSPPVVSISKTITNEPCGGYAVGAVQLSVSGGTPGYTFNWSNGDTTQNLSNLTAAVYYFTVTDANGCKTIDSANVTQPPGVVINSSITDASCEQPNGSIDITAQYGTPGYTYQWSDGSTSKNRTGLNPGDYIITVTDTIGCTASATENVGEAPSGISINYTLVHPSCFGDTNGSITINSVVGSTGPYTFLWNDSSTAQNRTNLGAGTYIVTATSSLGCGTADTIVLSQPAAINVSLTAVPLSCFGAHNGAINTTATNGISPYTFNWGGGVTTQDRTALAAGTYSVTVTDFKGCTMAATTTVTEPPQLMVTANPTGVTCAGGNTGSIAVSATGGTTNYSYWWGAGVISQNRTNLNAGTYTVTVTDAHGCTATATATVSGYIPMTVSAAQTNALCYGANSGSINLTVNNGSSPYHYNWSNSDTTKNIDSLPGGVYTVTITDNSSCTVLKSYTITQPPFAISPNVTITDVSCNGSNNGSISTNPTNGVSPYTYNWGGGITTQNRTGLAPGTYGVTITDHNGCSATATVGITQPTAVAVSLTDTNVSCYNGHSGAIGATATGGFAPYTYNWTGGSTSQYISALAAGNYSVTVTDNHSCSVSATTALSQAPNAVLLTSVTNIACNGTSTGAVNLNISGGTSPYTYNWGGGITSQNLSNVAAGNYTVIVTDSNSCTFTTSALVTQPTAISITASVTNIVCSSSNNGAINLTVSGGTSPYTFNWNDGNTNQNRSALAAGTFTVTVTDHAGCTAVNSSTVTQTSGITVIATATNVTCNGIANGAINITPVGGASPYTYNWGGGITSQNRTGLAPGTYTVNVTDHNGCTGVNTSTITQPTAITTSAMATAVSCNGGNNGSITLTVGGGSTPYTFNWGGGVTTQNRSNLSAGNYTVNITDSLGCTAVASATVNQPAAIGITPNATNVSCNGGNNGSISLNVSGGTGTYSYNWGGGVTSAGRSNLVNGNYSVTVTDINSCTATASATITQPAAISIGMTPSNALCSGSATGSITAIASGGTGTYTYRWSNNSTTQNLTSVAAGSYTLTVTDANTCTASNTASINAPSAINITLTSTNAACNGTATGSITSNTSGGTGTYSYSWSNTSSTQNLNNIASGTYTVTVKDANQCSATATTIVTQPAAVSVNLMATGVSCNGGNNGSISTITSGGNGGYTYSWNNTATTANISNLTSGNYSVTVKDVLNCSATGSASVNQPTALLIIPSAFPATCNGSSTGSITLNVSGGTPNYTYNWGGGITTAGRSNLTAGNYDVTITDASNCTASASASVSQPAAITVTAIATNTACYGQSSGDVTISVTGGTGTYSYKWTNNSTSQNLNNIAAGNYSVTVTDANSCTGTATATVGQASQILSTGFVTNASCNGSANGGVVLTVNGGAGGFTYHWSNNTGNQNLSSADAGTYSVTITDANSCTASNSFTITQPAAMVVTTTNTNVSCFGGSNASATASATGGAGNYTYNWNTGSSNPGITNLVAGSYQVTVKDASNCSATASANVSQPAAISYSTNVTPVSCYGGNNGAIGLGVSGGTAPYNFSWSNNGSANPLNNLAANTYSVTITDANACSTTGTATVAQPAAIVITESHSDFACSSDGGTISLSVTGGTGAYTYNWSGGINTANRTNLNAGIYTVTITDVNACTAVSSITVNQLPQMIATFNVQNVTCYNLNNGAINTTLTGGTPPYKFLWNNGDLTASITKLSAAVYELQVTDSNLCIITASATVNQPDSIGISATVTPVQCHAGNNGSINANVTGGTPGYTYQWSNQGTGATISNLAPSTYAVTVTDHSNCTSSLSSIVVNQPAAISVSATTTPAGCSGNSTGAIDLTVSGGNAPYQFNWSNSDNTQNISGLAAGAYTVTVTDSKNCTINTSATVGASGSIIVTASAQNASCTGINNGSIELEISGGTPSFTYAWNNGANTSSINNAAPGNYSVTVTDGGGCSTSAQAVIGTEYDLTVNINGSTAINAGQGSTLTAVTNVDHNNVYAWSPPEFVTCSTCASTQANPVQNSEFTVSVVDANGCKANSTININVNTQVNIFIPNAFSPNNDGNNDYFQIFGDLGSIQYLDMAIFDRWGEKVFESQEPQFKWDGTYKGEPAPMSVYVYTMTVVFADGSHQDFKGSVTLVK